MCRGQQGAGGAVGNAAVGNQLQRKQQEKREKKKMNEMSIVSNKVILYQTQLPVGDWRYCSLMC